MTLPWQGTRVVLVPTQFKVPIGSRLMSLSSSSSWKRLHGAPVKVSDHRQRSSGKKGHCSAYALDIVHPFTKHAALDVLQRLVVVDDPPGEGAAVDRSERSASHSLSQVLACLAPPPMVKKAQTPNPNPKPQLLNPKPYRSLADPFKESYKPHNPTRLLPDGVGMLANPLP